MAQFTLTARTNIDRPMASPALHISRGDSFNISINVPGITPQNLFNNSRCSAQLQHQLRLNGIDVPLTDRGIYNKGAWDIQPLRR